MIRFLDLKQQYEHLKDDIHKAIEDVLDSQEFIQGRYVKNFENEFIKHHKAPMALGVSSGTTALLTILKSLNLPAQSEVIVPSLTFFATAGAIVESGHIPRIVDIDSRTFNIDVKKIEEAITKKTKAIIAVHLYGNPCAMRELNKLCHQYNLLLIEDCAQAHMAQYDNIFVGNFGVAGAFSFYPGKNLGAYGDAGLIVSKNEELVSQMRMYIDHGRKEKYVHEFQGTNYRMDALQANILKVKLNFLEEWTKKRQAYARIYDQYLKENNFSVIEKNSGVHSECVYHLYVVQVSNREETINYLKNKEIQTGIHYPLPLHKQPALKEYSARANCPVSENVAERILSLPLYPEMNEFQIERVVQEFLKVAKP